MSALPESESERTQVETIQLVPIALDSRIIALGSNPDNMQRDRRETALRDELAAIAAKVGRRINIPSRPFTVEEWHVIHMLRSILRTAQVRRTWTKMVLTMYPAQARRELDEFGESAHPVSGEQAHSQPMELFGTTLPLGPVRHLAHQARLVNSAEIRSELAGHPHFLAQIRAHYVPGEDATLETGYPEWAPNQNAKGLARRLDAAERPVLLEPEESRRLNQLLESQTKRQLSTEERAELDALLGMHGAELLERSIGVFAVQNGLESSAARQEIEARYADALAQWSSLKSDPARLETAIESARQRRLPQDG